MHLPEQLEPTGKARRHAVPGHPDCVYYVWTAQLGRPSQNFRQYGGAVVPDFSLWSAQGVNDIWIYTRDRGWIRTTHDYTTFNNTLVYPHPCFQTIVLRPPSCPKGPDWCNAGTLQKSLNRAQTKERNREASQEARSAPIFLPTVRPHLDTDECPPALDKDRDFVQKMLSISKPATDDPLFKAFDQRTLTKEESRALLDGGLAQLVDEDYVVHFTEDPHGKGSMAWDLKNLKENHVFERGEETIQVVDTVRFAKGEMPYHCRVSVQEFLDSAGSQERVLNMLDRSYPKQDIPDLAKAVDIESAIRAAFPSSELVPADMWKKLTWVILTHAWATTRPHHDGGALSTWIKLALGEKWWFYCRLSPEALRMRREEPAKFAAMFHSADKLESLGTWYFLVLGPGSLLFQPLALWHMVHTPKASIMHGGHFATLQFHKMAEQLRLEALAGSHTTNASHPSWLVSLCSLTRHLAENTQKPISRKNFDALESMLKTPGHYLPQEPEDKKSVYSTRKMLKSVIENMASTFKNRDKVYWQTTLAGAYRGLETLRERVLED